MTAIVSALASMVAGNSLEHVDPASAALVAKLSEQAGRAINYDLLGLGWHHPETRSEYRESRHASHEKSRARQRHSVSTIAQLIGAALSHGKKAVRSAAVAAFVGEIGLPPTHPAAVGATFEGVSEALENELMDPLRALHEGRASMETTLSGQPVARHLIDRAVDALLGAVLRGEFKHWRYSNPVGQAQLAGLTHSQKEAWAQYTASTIPVRAPSKSRVFTITEGNRTELDLFWATKIGGPSHGFDFEGQCLLPLLCNARHKVVLLHDPAWPHAHPTGRAHLRLLWREGSHGGGAVLWLETTHADFRAAAQLDTTGYTHALLRHAVLRACALRLPLSVNPSDALELAEVLDTLAREEGAPPRGSLALVSERVVLRPSNGVLEASDYLSDKHDWVQLETETTQPLRRALFVPASGGALTGGETIQYSVA